MAEHAEDLALGAETSADAWSGSTGETAAQEPPQADRLPYPGLRPFRPDETGIFFGRDAALDAMAERLSETRFLAVLGPSGCGKSSLVRTGLYTTLRQGLLPNQGGRWKIVEVTPGRRPMRNLARELARAQAGDFDAPEPDRATVDVIADHLKRGPRSVIELAESGTLGDITDHVRRGPHSVIELAEAGMLRDGANLLIVVDQFEELFRFRDYAEREEADAFVALLLESARSALSIHIVITMRSEYLGACSLIPGLAEQISEGMFLTPRMTRDECREAIVRPAEVRGFDIEPDLVARILNDLQSFAPFERSESLDQADQLSLQADQLPLMQHVLNRMWRHAARHGQVPGQPLSLTLRDYDDVRGLTGALDEHGNEILKGLETELGEDGARTVGCVFRALVDGPSLPLAVRRPRQLGDLIKAAGGEEQRGAVAKIVEAFRGPDSNFLRMSGRALTDRMIVDIGHESLIRRWSKLRDWFADEGDARDQWNRLSQDAELWKKGKIEAPRDLGLRRFTDWWSSERPSPYLAARYGGDFATVTAFLDASKAAEGRRKRTKMLARIGVLLIAMALIAYLSVTNLRLQEAKQTALASQADTQRILLVQQRTTTDFAEAKSVLQNGFRECGERARPSPAYDRCVSESLDHLIRTHANRQPLQEQRELQAPANGPAGGAVP